jgi:hypothetical protein
LKNPIRHIFNAFSVQQIEWRAVLEALFVSSLVRNPLIQRSKTLIPTPMATLSLKSIRARHVQHAVEI